jgi:DNA-binding transcriptional ArsR family regulator
MNAPARRTDPETSHEAADSVELPDLEALVLAELRALPDGATSHELAASLELPLVTVSPRLRPLANRGLVIDSGFKRVGTSGRRQIVWRARREPRPMQQEALL